MSSYTEEELAAIAAKREAKRSASKRSRTLFEAALETKGTKEIEDDKVRDKVRNVGPTKAEQARVINPEAVISVPWFMQLVPAQAQDTSNSDKGNWSLAVTFASKVQIDMSTRISGRASYAKCLEDLKSHAQGWKTNKFPLLLIGEIGCGKTWLLYALASHLDMDVECLQDIFLDPPSSSVLEQLGTRGFSTRPKMWVVEHADMLTPQWTAALKKTFSSMLKSGPVFLTSWPDSKQKPEHALELSSWNTESKLAFLRTQGFSEKSSKFLLQESGSEFGTSICGALECAKVWGSDLVRRASLEEGEESCPPPINLRLLLEESFTTRWTLTRSLALETYDLELSLGLTQEMAVSAASVGKTDMALLASQLDHLSAMDLAQRKCSEIASWFVHDRVVQQQTLRKAKASMSKFTTGTLVPLPQSLIHLSKKKSSLQTYQDALLKSRHMDTEATEHLRDTRTYSDEVEIFMRASGLKWKSPFKKTE